MPVPSKRLVSAAVLGVLACLGHAPATQAAKPIRGATYTGTFDGGAGNISIGVSADGKRVFGPRGAGLAVMCPEGATETAFDVSNTVSAKVSRKGAFGRIFAGDSAARLSGTFLSGGRLRGRVRYRDRADCAADRGFVARSLPRNAGLRNPLFTAAFDTGGPPREGAAATASTILANGVDELRDGSLVVADASAQPAIRRIDLNGRVRTILGPGSGIGDPGDVAVLPGGDILLADPFNNCVRRISGAGAMSVAAGQCAPQGGFAGDGGPATAALLGSPLHLSVAPDGGFYVSDGGEDGIFSENLRVRRVTPDGTISTVAGNGMAGSTGDGGPAIAASFRGISALLAQADGGFLVADPLSFFVRRVSPEGTISTVAGSGFGGFSGDGGPATGARLEPNGLASAPGGGVLISDRAGSRLRRVSPSGIIRTAAGSGEVLTGVPAARAALQRPGPITVLRNGAIVFADPTPLSFIAGRNERRLLIGLPARYITYKRSLVRRRALPVRVTRRSVVSVVLRTNGRTVMRARRTLRPGLRSIRLPRRLRPRLPTRLKPGFGTYRMSFTATAGQRIATVRQDIFFR